MRFFFLIIKKYREKEKCMHVEVGVLKLSRHPLDGSSSFVMWGNSAAPCVQTGKGKR